MPVLLLEGLLLLVLLAIAIVILFERDLLATAIIYCAFSFGAMLLYILVGAADVAFTEAVIGTISTVYFVIAIKSINRRRSAKMTRQREAIEQEESREGKQA